MILVDTSVWIDHLRRSDAALVRQLDAGNVLTHPFVIGEIACGHLPRRGETLLLMGKLPLAPVVGHAEALGFIERYDLAGQGVGYVDMHMLASARLARTQLWTRDKRLAQAAAALGIAYRSAGG
ncbi:MAG: type II toxin-antitoxin system VapC family toxin [Caldimonas sp.]